ncbi:F-box domain-containing protein [Ustulina deusta]|nr:F-box domain-containing protein [Ustulina deusta]
MDRVLLIPELLESILLHLDLGTLLVSALRVNKTWNVMINTSISIQRALYFQPVPTLQQPGVACQPIVNPLLKKHFGNCFFDTGRLHGYLRRANAFYTMPCAGTLWDDGDDPTPPFPRGPEVADMKLQKIHEVEAACRKFTRKEATWRKMLVSQPPPPCLGYLRMEDVEDSSQLLNGPYWVQTTLIRPETDPDSPGLCMGTLYDIVQHHTGHHTRRSRWFRVVWDQAREPYGTPSAMECCRRLLKHTNVVVEFYHTFDYAVVEHREPQDASLFDKRFRSEAHRNIDINIDDEAFVFGDILAFDRSYFLR